MSEGREAGGRKWWGQARNYWILQRFDWRKCSTMQGREEETSDWQNWEEVTSVSTLFSHKSCCIVVPIRFSYPWMTDQIFVGNSRHIANDRCNRYGGWVTIMHWWWWWWWWPVRITMNWWRQNTTEPRESDWDSMTDWTVRFSIIRDANAVCSTEWRLYDRMRQSVTLSTPAK